MLQFGYHTGDRSQRNSILPSRGGRTPWVRRKWHWCPAKRDKTERGKWKFSRTPRNTWGKLWRESWVLFKQERAAVMCYFGIFQDWSPLLWTHFRQCTVSNFDDHLFKGSNENYFFILFHPTSLSYFNLFPEPGYSTCPSFPASGFPVLVHNSSILSSLTFPFSHFQNPKAYQLWRFYLHTFSEGCFLSFMTPHWSYEMASKIFFPFQLILIFL